MHNVYIDVLYSIQMPYSSLQVLYCVLYVSIYIYNIIYIYIYIIQLRVYSLAIVDAHISGNDEVANPRFSK